MAGTVEIRALTRDDDRSGFSCGQADLDRFFQHYAGQNQFKLRLAVTYVAVAGDRIVGFVTVAASSLERSSVPSARLRKKLPTYPLPVLRVARLGVDLRAQGLGIGRALLRHALLVGLDQRDAVGCVGVLVDAKPESTAFYGALGFERVEDVREGLMHGEPVPMFLNIDAIASAVTP